LFGSVRSVRYFRVAKRNGRDVLNLPSGPVKLRNFASAAAVDYVRIERIGCDVTVFDYADGTPIAEGDGAVVAAAWRCRRTALLLAGANLIRENPE